MRYVLPSLISLVLSSSFAMAADLPADSTKVVTPAAPTTAVPVNPAMMHQQHQQKMQEKMQKIQEVKDPNERQRLMQEQMQEMRKMMREERATHYAPAPMMQPYAQPYYGAPMPMMPQQQFMPYPPRTPQFAGNGYRQAWGDEQRGRCGENRHQGRYEGRGDDRHEHMQERHEQMEDHHEQMEQHLIKIEQLLEKLVELEAKQVAK